MMFQVLWMTKTKSNSALHKLKMYGDISAVKILALKFLLIMLIAIKCCWDQFLGNSVQYVIYTDCFVL